MSLEEIGVFTPRDAARVWQATLAVERSGSVKSGPFVPVDEPIQFRNDSGETIPAYACVQLTGTVEDGGRNLFIADKPIDTSSALVDCFVFNNEYEVPTGEFGTAQCGQIKRAIKTSSLVLGARVGPKNNDWEIGTGAFWTYLGSDDVVTDCIRVKENDSLVLAVATSGVPARNGTTLGKASVAVKHLNVSSTDRVIADSGFTVTAFNLAATAVATGAYVMLLRLGDVHVVVWEECPEI
jgi:hypothetical protein